MISSIKIRTILCFRRMSVAAEFHTAGSTCRDFQCCLDGVAFHRLEDLCRNLSIRFQSAERNAPVRSVIDLRPAAMISGHLSMRAAVGHMEHPTAPPAAQ